MTNLARKDLFTCLGIWLALELICFAILPLLRLGLPRAALQPWFLFSLLLGIGGALLTAGSTQMGESFRSDTSLIRGKGLQKFCEAIVGWLGLIGIGFPILVVSMQVLEKVFSLFKS